jgi:hypothetical protein
MMGKWWVGRDVDEGRQGTDQHYKAFPTRRSCCIFSNNNNNMKVTMEYALETTAQWKKSSYKAS